MAGESTLAIMGRMARRQGMNARSIALKVYGSVAFEAEVCRILHLPRVTPSFSEEPPRSILPEDVRLACHLARDGWPWTAALAAQLVGEYFQAEIEDLLQPGGRGPGRRVGRRALVVLLADGLLLPTALVSELLGYSRSEVLRNALATARDDTRLDVHLAALEAAHAELLRRFPNPPSVDEVAA